LIVKSYQNFEFLIVAPIEPAAISGASLGWKKEIKMVRFAGASVAALIASGYIAALSALV
jgi:hypothetical protein